MGQKQERWRGGIRLLVVGMLVNLALIAVKGGLGWFSGSRALLADAVHSFSDFFNDGVVIAGVWMGSQEADNRHPFGHGRFETLAAAVVGISLAAMGLGLAWETAQALWAGEVSNPAPVAVVGAVISLVTKEAMFRWSRAVGTRLGSRAILANAWDQRADALSSLVVLAGLVGGWLLPGKGWLDSAAALVVAAFILHSAWQVLTQSWREIADEAPDDAVIKEMEQCARTVGGVMEVHDLKARLSGGRYVVQMHVVVDGCLSVRQGHRIAHQVEDCLRRQVRDLDQAVIHVDPPESLREGIDEDEPRK